MHVDTVLLELLVVGLRLLEVHLDLLELAFQEIDQCLTTLSVLVAASLGPCCRNALHVFAEFGLEPLCLLFQVVDHALADVGPLRKLLLNLFVE